MAYQPQNMYGNGQQPQIPPVQTSQFAATPQYEGTSGNVPQEQGYFPPGQQQMTDQLAGMSLSADAQHVGRKKKDRHAYHSLEREEIVQPAAPAFAGAQGQYNSAGAPQGGFGAVQQPGMTAPGVAQNTFNPQLQHAPRSGTPLHGAAVGSAQGRVDPAQVPSIPWSRDAPAQFYLSQVYPTMEQHLPPPSSVPFVAVDQGNASPKFARLTCNNIPASNEQLSQTALPLGLILQPLAPRQDGELPVPVIDFGEVGPPRCRRCRAYINPFMVFRSGGNKFVCNMCTFPNDVTSDYFAPTDPSGARVDRMQRPELSLGTVEFTAPREYWTKQPVPQTWLFLIDVSSESVSKGLLLGVCQGILAALYKDTVSAEATDGEENKIETTKLALGSQIGIVTYDKEVHFYSLAAGLDQPQMVVMSDIEEPFCPISDGLFVDPIASRAVITSLLNSIPKMFSRIKNPEPALLPALNAATEALKPTGGRIICSLASLPTWGPGRLFMRDRPEMKDTDGEKKLFQTEHPSFMKAAKEMTENGIGADFFLAAPGGGYMDMATIGWISEKTGGEVYYYPNFHAPRDHLKVAKELEHALTRESGFQALLKVRCSNGLQVHNYFGNFTQHTFGADLEFGVIDADKAVGVQFSYDGKLDPKLDAHFQSALLYTTATGERRIRCSNMVASVSDGAMESMKLVDQDAVITLLAKQACSQLGDKSLKDVRARITERSIDILAAYRKNFSGSHPPGQLVLPEHLKEFGMYMLGLSKCRAIKSGNEPTDRRVYDSRLIRGMGAGELSLYLYPRIIAIHSLSDEDGFPNENGYLKMPPTIRASYSIVEEGGAYLVDCGQTCILWLHANVSPNLLEDLFGPDKNSLQSLDPYLSAMPVLETHLNAQVRNILQYLEDNRGSKALTIQLARQGLDGAEFEFARLLVEDRNNDAQSYVDWLVHLHRHIQLELQGQRKKDDGGENSTLASLQNLQPRFW